MALLALAIPILPGKTPEWRAWMEELNGPRQQEFADSRKKVGLRERTFLQSTPMGDLVIVTLEGDDPGRTFGELMSATDAFSTWFTERAMAVHGEAAKPSAGSAPSELVVDSNRVAVPA
jgi:hypothetical protein